MGLNVLDFTNSTYCNAAILPVVTKRIFPSLPGSRLVEFLSRCKFRTLLQLVNQWINGRTLHNSRSHAIAIYNPLRKPDFFFFWFSQESNSRLAHYYCTIIGVSGYLRKGVDIRCDRWRLLYCTVPYRTVPGTLFTFHMGGGGATNMCVSLK